MIEYVIQSEIKQAGFEIINGNGLEKKNGAKLSTLLSYVKRNVAIDYGQFGMHLPDVDMIIYKPQSGDVVAVLSIKTTLRERIAQTAYWKLKLAAQPITNHIKLFFLTLDEDGTLTVKQPPKKGRAISEVDTDGCFVLSETQIEESPKVQMFDKFIAAIKQL